MAPVAPLLATIFVLLASVVAPAHDALVTVGSDRLHVETLGESNPTIVFEAGLGNDSTTWKSVAGPIAAFAHVVLYDRVGLGQSSHLEDNRAALTADEVAGRLHALLATADIRPPYILVGHSLGGLYMQMFARKYPTEVSGVVLLEASSTEAPNELKTRAKLVPGTAAYLEEEGVAESNQQVRNAGPFPDVPLTVIAATDHGPYFREWEPTLMRLQQQLATLSPQGSLIVAQGSGHDVQQDRPETVIEAVRRMAAAVQAKR
ncbi:alpha/beta hydrolase [Bradyrhizobium sp. CCGUVB1N3]|uniref:alpha/beta fold hydrolase n=1 Tax=Bradyrhizobium sp. CCGUVB1N3 TaxID=2949629 RepID=UPI0020B3E697|nr:alpha/beta hydrolase [Bradyrhizobium sp. CCGUVB1N3]MCP3470153.1 alpha/beta hydrolase [Bradyrhizobium sp. CCGUVB1N3]